MAFPLETWTKDPASTLDYNVDWDSDDWLGTDTIASVTWTVPAGITSVSTSATTTIATIFVSGGTVGQDYDIGCRITTVGGRIDERTIRLKVRQR
jgi:hypothetical protein